MKYYKSEHVGVVNNKTRAVDIDAYEIEKGLYNFFVTINHNINKKKQVNENYIQEELLDLEFNNIYSEYCID